MRDCYIMFYLPPPRGYSGYTRLYDDTKFMVPAKSVASLEMMAVAWEVSMSEALERAIKNSFLLVDEHAIIDARRRLWPAPRA